MRNSIVLAFLVAVGLTMTSTGDVIYVDASAGDDNWTGECAVWDGVLCGPKRTIQAALDVAQDYDTVSVADGEYRGDGNRDLHFKGSSKALRSRSGPQFCVIDCEKNGRGFVFRSGESNDCVVEGVTIKNAYSASFGGGIACDGCNPIIIRCIIADCVSGKSGGGVCAVRSNLTLSDCVFTANRAWEGRGGAIFLSDFDDCHVLGCTVSGNDASGGNFPDQGHAGGLFAQYFHSLTVRNSVFWGNTASGKFPELMVSGNEQRAAFHVHWSDVEGGQGAQWISPPTMDVVWEGCIDSNPRFMDPSNQDFHLGADSPLKEAGGTFACLAGRRDADGNERVCRYYPDIGAYEHPDAPRYRGDMNCDCRTDFNDIDGFVLALIDPSQFESAFPQCDYLLADIDGNGSVDFDDIDPFVICLEGGECR